MRAAPSKGGVGVVPILGAGIAAWLVWSLMKPGTASAAEGSKIPPGALPPPSGQSLPSGGAVSSGSDPHPDWPLLSQAHSSRGQQVVTWQQTLVKGGFLPNAPASWDGVFGPLTTAATKLLQQKGTVAQDGIVGPDTRTAARKLGLW